LAVEEKEKLALLTKLAKFTFYKQAAAKTYQDRGSLLLLCEVQYCGILNVAVFPELFQG
jgi:hypothetical protein